MTSDRLGASRSRGHRLVRALLPGAVAVLTLVLTGCVQLPESGPVTESAPRPAENQGTGAFYMPVPPQPGESATEIVTRFLDSMRANPLQTSVARQFLSRGAREDWRPEAATITYGDTSRAVGQTEVRVRLSDAHRLDERGAWTGPLPQDQTTIRFPMVQEGGEWRINEAPDALVVPEGWFEAHFRQVSLYFFDPTGQVLVPEPVFVPRGEQLATTLTRGLLLGPGERLRGVSRTFLPSEATVELSVPVTASGVAEIALQGDVAQLSPEGTALMLAQLSWTLRQEPTIRSIRLSIGGEPVSPPGSATEFRVSGGQEFDPAVVGATSRLFGLRRGRVIDASPGAGQRIDGPLGHSGPRLRELAVDLVGDTVAGVQRNGRSVVLAPVAVDEPVQEVARGEDLLKPAWDFAGRLWLLDRTSEGARVSFVAGSEHRRLRVPGITGEDVSRFLVSRDGSRLVAVVRRGSADSVVVSRIRHDELGQVRGATEALPIAEEDAAVALDIRDIGWRSPSAVLVLDGVTDELAELLTVPVDGSHGAVSPEIAPNLMRERAERLVTSPADGDGLYLVTEDSVIDLAAGERVLVPVDPRIRGLTFAG